MTLKNMQVRLRWTKDESLPFIQTMNDLSKKIGNAIRTARKQRGLVMKDVAEAIGVTIGAVGNWERGANVQTMENLRLVANFLKLDLMALNRGELKYLDEAQLADAEIITDPGPVPTGPMDVELLGVAAAGDDGDFTINGNGMGYVRRPPGLVGLKNVFALNVISDSMVPRYDPGELIYCGGRPPVAGDHVVIEMYPDDGASIGKAYVKKLVRRTSSEIQCYQYNPARELTFDAYRVKHIWRIIPPRELFGF